jgi:hypothetical protein
MSCGDYKLDPPILLKPNNQRVTAEITIIGSESQNSYERLHLSRNGTGSKLAPDKLELYMPARPQITTSIWVTQLIQNLRRVYSKSWPRKCASLSRARARRVPHRRQNIPFFSDLDRGGTYQVRIYLPFPVNIDLIVG